MSVTHFEILRMRKHLEISMAFIGQILLGLGYGETLVSQDELGLLLAGLFCYFDLC